MRPAENIRKLIENLSDKTSARMDQQVRQDILHALAESEKASALTRPKIGRTIMKSPITKLAAAAVIIAVVVLGLFEFITTENKSGVVWAQVAEKVQASGGLIVRCKEITSFQLDDGDHAIKYFAPMHSRTDSYKNGQIVKTFYTNLETKTLTAVFHPHKHYITGPITGSGEGFLEKQEDWMNPRYLVQKILSCKHRMLEPKTIDGTLCEGLETTDPAVFGPLPGPVNRLDVQFRLWVSMETEYPVLFEWKVNAEAEGQVIANEGVMDQFQWDAELDPSVFEPNIPPDYKDMRNL